MGTRPKLDLDFFRRSGCAFLLVLLFSLCFAENSQATFEDLKDPEAQYSNLIEIEYPPVAYLPYRERRQDWGYLFGFRYDNTKPVGYRSSIDQARYVDLFGEGTLPMFSVRGGAKKNLSGFSLTAEGSYGTGMISDARSGTDTTLQVTSMGAHFGFWLDTLFQDPYVVPYGQVDVLHYDYVESSGGTKSTGSVAAAIGWTTGVMFQLNWLDPDSSRRSLVETNLNNAYVDLFATRVQPTSGTDLGTDLTWGAGLQLEF